MIRKLLILIVLGLGLLKKAYSQGEFRPFITTWNVPSEGQFVIPLTSSLTYNFEFYVIQETDTLFSGQHVNADGDFIFGSIDEAIVELHIYGQFPHFANYTKNLLLDVNQWGDIVWESMSQSFSGWGGTGFSATDAPVLSDTGVNFFRIFRNAFSFNGDIGHWDVRNVSSFSESFDDARSFNQDLGAWDVSNITGINGTFRDARSFQGIGLSQWDIKNVTNFNGAFNNTAIPTTVYDSILISWAAQEIVKGVSFGAVGIEACSPEAQLARISLIENNNWIISDAGTCDEATDILSFKILNEQVGESIIDFDNNTITIEVFPDTDKTNLVADIILSEGASSSPASGIAQDFSNNVTYTVTAENGLTTQEWTVNVISTDQRPFITSWSAIAGESITIELSDNLSYNFNYSWKDIDGNEITSGRHTSDDGDFVTSFATTETVTLEITGAFPHFQGFPKNQLINVSQWGDIVWESMQSSFEDWSGEVFSAIDAPNLSNVSSMRNMFFNASNFNSSLNHWDVSNITMMRNLFSGAASFNQDLDNWNVSKVFDFESVFRNALAFNGDISNWEVNKATTMFLMFSGAESFNQDISDWQPVKVFDMRDMFAFTKVFNQDISQWNVQTVQNMGRMFFEAKGFDQDLSDWNISGAVNMAFMFEASGLSPQNYDKTLIGWSEKEVKDGVTLGAQGITFCKAVEARQSLIDDHSWVINDAGNFCSSSTDILFFHSNLENGLGILHYDDNTISLAVTEGTDISGIVPTIELSPGATISPESGAPVNLNTVVYTVTAEDGVTTQDWTFEFTGPRFITIWVVKGDEGLVIDGSEEGFDYDFEFIIVDANNTVISTGNGTTFQAEFPFEAGEYRVEITGEFPHFAGYPGDQLVDVLQWGDIQWKSMRNSFRNWTGERFSATDVPDLSQVTNMAGMFFNAQAFNGDITDWDVSNVTKMQNTFRDARAFNQDISSWEVNEVTDMFGMFQNAISFNADIEGWNVGLVSNMTEMFRGATLFNQDLGGWNITSVTSMVQMFNNSGLSPQNYDKTLIGWAVQEVKDNVTLGAEGITFCKAAEARQSLIDDHSWVINDVGSFCSSETDILSFTIEGQLGETIIDADNHTVALTMPFKTDIRALVANYTISAGAAASIESGAIIDFSSSVIYTITAEDGVTIQDWEIAVTEAPNIANDIENVEVNVAVEEVDIDAETHTVNMIFSFGTDITAIPVLFTYSEGATSSVGEGGTFDFTDPLAITVTAQDGVTSQEWTISGAIAPNIATDIETVTLDADTEEILIDTETHTVNMRFSFGTDISAIPVLFTYSEGATSSVGEGGTFDFTDPLAITVTAQDGVTSQEWTISGTIALNTATDILSVVVGAQTDEILIDTETHTVNMRFSFGTDISAIPVLFTYSEGATSSVGEGGTFDFTDPLAITVTAQDGVTSQEWTISGTIALNTATDILSVVVGAQTDEIVIDNEAHTVDMVFASNTDLSSVFLEFTLSEGGTSSPVSGSSFDLTSSATISVTAEDGITTQDWTISAEADNVLGVINDAMVFQFYPNPVQDVLNVQTQNRSRVYLSNIQGIQMTPEVVGLQFQFNLSELQPGVYQLIVIEGGNISISKIIKTN